MERKAEGRDNGRAAAAKREKKRKEKMEHRKVEACE